MPMKKVITPGSPDGIVLVPRASLRREKPAKKIKKARGQTLPPPPASFSWGGQTQFPVLGNNQVGNCFYTTCLHAVQSWFGMRGNAPQFDAGVIIKRYLELSGGDNGLYTDQMMGEWRRGIVGPDGPHKILDELDCTTADPDLIKSALWYFGGISLTLAIPELWLRRAAPGAVWDAGPGVYPDDDNGHAVWLTGAGAGHLEVQTWGYRPPISLGWGGLGSCDSEATVVFSGEWFDPETQKAPNGIHYAELATLWAKMGGSVPPPAPPVPVPVPPSPEPPGPIPPPNPGPTDPPIYDVSLQVAGPFGRPVVITGSLTPRRGDRGDPLAEAFGSLRPAGMPLAEWLAVVQAILAIIAEQLGKHPPKPPEPEPIKRYLPHTR